MVKLRRSDGKVIDAKVGEQIINYASPKDLVAKVDGKRLVDLKSEIKKEFKEIELLSFEAEEAKDVFWHTSAHILAQAVKRLFPQTQLAIGHATEKGFFYEFDIDRPFSREDLDRIEAEMLKILKEDLEIRREEITKEEALKLFKGEKYKTELIREIPEKVLSIYRQGEFVDLCTGPHLPRTGMVGTVKLLYSSACFWKGIEGNPSLQRIYGISFPTPKEMEEFMRIYQESLERDHRELGKRFELFEVGIPEVGSGLVLWYPKGAILRELLEQFLKKVHLAHGYQLVVTPHLAMDSLWEKSGHLKYYKENMFHFELDGQRFCVKPMNCPFHILIFKSKRRSYRELPIRYFELGTVYRFERSGVLHGLTRVRGFTQDDAHIFCREDQIGEEVGSILDLATKVLSKFGFKEFDIDLSISDPEHPEKFMGSPDKWKTAEEALRRALDVRKVKYREAMGEAAFYGPKIDVKLLDALGRKWQCSTIQLDFNLPEKFDLTYIDEEQKERRVVMIHRTLIGAIERFVGVLLEHTKGDLPIFLAPIQVAMLPVSEKNLGYASKLHQELIKNGIRSSLLVEKTLEYRVREAELNKIPYIVVVGKEEESRGEVCLRRKGSSELRRIKPPELIQLIKSENESIYEGLI